MTNIEHLKEKAIEETLTYFKKKYGITPDSDKLLKRLNSNDEYIEEVLLHSEELIKQGKEDDLLTDLHDSFVKIEKVKNKIRFIKYSDNDIKNQYFINVIDDFCELSLLYHFFSGLISKLNQSIIKRLKKNKFSHTELALLLYLNDEVLFDPRGDPDKKAEKIALEYGFDSTTSGQKLYNEYKKTLNSFNEWDRNDVNRIMKCRRDRITKVLPLVKPGKHKEEAERILKELHNKLN